jgi:ABC-type cobalamin/Fe3+-siderophores transport system ATPase subunit
MTGANGVGKTTLAKLLAGVREVAQGSIKVVTEAFGGQGRLLLQDPLLHLFSMSPREHLLRVFAHDQERRERAFDLFEDLEAQCACTLKEHNACITVGHRDEPSSILQAKLVLAAERLVTPTPLLIIDEPGWCLSRPVARVFLSTVTDCAHARGTAVLAISNQASWWQGISRDYLSLVEKEGRIRVEQGQR